MFSPWRARPLARQRRARRSLAVHEQVRRLEVRGGMERGEGGEVLEFVLRPATARFVSAGSAHGPWLELLRDQ